MDGMQWLAIALLAAMLLALIAGLTILALASYERRTWEAGFDAGRASGEAWARLDRAQRREEGP